jgi:hypothetical protein
MLVVGGIFVLSIFGRSVQQSNQTTRENAVERGAWRDDISVSISRSLVKGGATGCGEYRYLSVNRDAEYIVECFDGTRKRYYQVFPKIESIVGPYDNIPTN